MDYAKLKTRMMRIFKHWKNDRQMIVIEFCHLQTFDLMLIPINTVNLIKLAVKRKSDKPQKVRYI